MKKLLFLLLVLGWQSSAVAQETTGEKTPGDSNVLFILDASGSMWGQIGGASKIAIAKQEMSRLVNELENTKMGLIAYGHRRKGDCNDIENLVELGNRNKGTIIKQIKAITPKGKTPITKSIEIAAKQLQPVEDESEIILVSDGRETCEGDPCVYVKELKQKGIRFRMHVIGFDVNHQEREQLECIAKAGGGKYFSAQNAAQFKNALNSVKKQVIEVKKPTFRPPPKVKKPTFRPPPKVKAPKLNPLPKVETPKLNPAPKVEAPKLNPAPKVETPKLNPAPKVETPKLNPAPKVEAPKLNPAPKVEAPKLNPLPKVEKPKLNPPPKVEMPEVKKPEVQKPRQTDEG